ncbi:unnamed protein product, partial [Clonostachys rhizophaga]
GTPYNSYNLISIAKNYLRLYSKDYKLKNYKNIILLTKDIRIISLLPLTINLVEYKYYNRVSKLEKYSPLFYIPKDN